MDEIGGIMKVQELIARNEIGSGSRIWIAEFRTWGIGKKVSNKTLPIMAEVAGDRLLRISPKTGAYLSGYVRIRSCGYEAFLTEQEAIDYYNGKIRECIESAERELERYTKSLAKNIIE